MSAGFRSLNSSSDQHDAAVRRERELETLLQVARITASTLDLETVLRRIIDQLEQVLACSAVAINIYEGDEAVVLARRGPGNLKPGAKMPGRRHPLLTAHHQAGAPVIIDDVRGPSELAAAYRDMVGGLLDEAFAHVCSYMAVPLLGKHGAFGSLTVSWHEPGYYTEDDGRLLVALAGHAALAIENARLFDEAQQRTHELEMLLNVARDTASSLELDTVLERLMDRIEPVIATNSLAINAYDGKDYVLLARRGPPGLVPGQRTPGQRPPEFSEAFKAGRAVIIDDIRGTSTLAAAYRDMVGEALNTSVAHVCSYMAVPLRGRSGPFGVLTVSSAAPAQYTEEDGRLLMAFADHAALAIENARLYEESRRRATEMEALHRADEALHRSLHQQDVMTAMNDLAFELLGADGSVLYTWESDGRHGSVATTRGFSPEIEALIAERFRSRSGAPPRSPDVVVSGDCSADSSLDPVVVAATGVRSLVELPIMSGDHFFGVFSVGYLQQREFREADRKLFATFATRAGVAMENARLFAEAQKTASLEERQKLARELHDSVSQALYGIALGTRTASMWLDRDAERAREPLDYALGLAEVGLAEMRALIFELRPESLEAEGLVAALNRQAAAISARHEIEVITDMAPEPEIDPRAREALYRIAQESMHNVVKHAGAGRIELRLVADERSVTLEVADNGRGFDPDGNFPGHLGLRSMAERAAGVGASYEIESTEGAGTRVRVRLPLTAA